MVYALRVTGMDYHEFDEDGVKDVISKYFGTLRNVYTFFALYANTDSIDPKNFFVEYKDRPELDRWILSKYNNLVKEVDAALDVYDLTRAARKIHNFVMKIFQTGISGVPEGDSGLRSLQRTRRFIIPLMRYL